MQADWSHDGHEFQGLSLSGVRTCITYPALKLCFDVAQGLPFCLNMKHFFISHGHLDHAAGIPYIISQKAMHKEAPPNFYMPLEMIDPMTEIMKNWQILEDHKYQLQFTALKPGDRVDINPQYFVEAFPTVHRVPSQGYALFSKHKKLLPQYLHLSGPDIRDLKKAGHTIEEEIHQCLFAFSGDTQIEFLERSLIPQNAKILFIECTYLDERKSIEHAKKWGHIHLEELLLKLDSLQCEKIVLKHISSRYSTAQAEKILREKIPARHQPRILIFPGR